MIPCEYLDLLRAVVREANKVFDNIEQTLLLKNALKERVELRKLRILVAAVRRFPFHKAILAGGDRSGFRGELVAHNENRVIHEHRRNIVHIIAKL